MMEFGGAGDEGWLDLGGEGGRIWRGSPGWGVIGYSDLEGAGEGLVGFELFYL